MSKITKEYLIPQPLILTPVPQCQHLVHTIDVMKHTSTDPVFDVQINDIVKVSDRPFQFVIEKYLSGPAKVLEVNDDYVFVQDLYNPLNIHKANKNQIVVIERNNKPVSSREFVKF